jgi:hypothetical protein
VLHPNEYLSGIHDVMAAEMLAAASQSHPEAAELSDGINDMFGAAYICRQRAARLNDAAARATYAGQHDLAAMIGAAATRESAAADEYELVGASCIRGMHSFGYLSDMEKRQLARDAFLQNASASQVDSALASLTKKLYEDVTNYGMDADGFGGEQEAEEIMGGGCSAFGDACVLLGGDVPVVFGDEFYATFGKLFKPSAERLMKRQARLQKRLDKLMEKLETLEDQGKSGLRVRVLQKRIDLLETRLGKIAEKLEALNESSEMVQQSQQATAVVRAAEQSSIDSVTDSDDDFPESDDDLLFEDDDEDFGLMSEIDVFGASERRIKRIQRRILRLKRRMARLEARDRGPLREKRIAKLQTRIAKLEAKLGTLDSDADLDALLLEDDEEEESYTASLITPQVKAFTEEEWLASFAGMLAADPGSANRCPYVQYFRRKTDAGGSMNISPAVMGQENEGFFARIGKFFSNLFSTAQTRVQDTAPRRQQRRQQMLEASRRRRAKARAFIQTKAEGLQARTVAARQARQAAMESTKLRDKLKAARQARRQMRQAGRRAFFINPAGQRVAAPAPASSPVPDGEYFDDAGYAYAVQDGVLAVVSTPNTTFSKPVAPPGGQDLAMANLKRDLESGKAQAAGGKGSAYRRRPVPMPSRRAMKRRAMKRRARYVANARRRPLPPGRRPLPPRFRRR